VADEIMQQAGVGCEAVEKDYGPIHLGQGVGEILKEREEALKAIQLKLKAAEEKKAGESEK
jgi:hypothetical protein